MAAEKNNKYSQKYTDKDIDALCESILNFAEKARSAHFATWTRSQGKVPSWLHDMIERYPKLAKAYEDAKGLMSCKLLNSSIYCDDKNFNSTHAMYYLPVYDKNLRDYLKWRAEISKEQPVKEENKGAFNSWAQEQKKE